MDAVHRFECPALGCGYGTLWITDSGMSCPMGHLIELAPYTVFVAPMVRVYESPQMVEPDSE
jgi:hypothetical protein